MLEISIGLRSAMQSVLTVQFW